MIITPLQYALSVKTIPNNRIREACQVHRTTLWRWKMGLSRPQRLEAQALVELFEGVPLVIDETATVFDFNACYVPSVEVEETFFDNKNNKEGAA